LIQLRIANCELRIGFILVKPAIKEIFHVEKFNG
jgi:hypothetical protein